MTVGVIYGYRSPFDAAGAPGPGWASDVEDALDRIEKAALAPAVSNFGAAGDGTTDDRAAFQALIDTRLAAGGGPVLVPPPSNFYAIGTPGLVMDNNNGLGSGLVSVGVLGSNAAAAKPRLVYTGSTGQLISFHNSSGLFLNGVTLDYNNASYAGNLIDCDLASHVYIDLARIGGSNIAAKSARCLVRLNRTLVAHISRVAWGYADKYVIGVDSDYSNIVTIRNCFGGPSLCGTVPYFNAGEDWTIEGCGQEPLQNGNAGFYDMQTSYAAYGLAFRGNWLGDVSNGLGTWIDNVRAYGFTWNGGRVTGGDTFINFNFAASAHVTGVLPAVSKAFNWSVASSRSTAIEGVNFEQCPTPYTNKTNCGIRHFKGNFPNTYNEDV